MPALARLIRDGVVALHPVPSGLPTSTPAFQAGLMYGGPVDVPGFEFVDKRTGTYRWFPRPWDAAAVEAAHARPGQGIVRGGRTYGCVFGGGADDTVLTFAHVLRSNPAYWGRVGVRALIVPTGVLAWLVAKMSVASVGRLVRWLGGALRDFSLGRRIRSFRRMLTQLLIGGWLRELFTLGVTADLYAGVPALYVNFVEYDVAAHEVGPRHREAFRALRGIDRSIARFARVLRRIPEHHYDLFVLSDHGQIRSVPFHAVAGGVGVAEAIVGCFGPECGPRPAPEPPATDAAPHRAMGPGRVAPALPLWPFTSRWQRELACTERPVRERNAVWIAGLCIVPAGPNVNVYLTHTTRRVLAEEIEARYPGALDRLSRYPAIGFVLARDARGPVCYYRGEVFRIPPHPGTTGCPVFDRHDRDVVVRGLLDLLEMPSGGDVILYGHYTEAGCVNFLDERGSHAGPSEDELYAFMAAPPGLAFDFRAVRRARDLHALFARYHEETDD
jgi:type I phosphodiesterase/nucleotide pyrophosphatase